MIKDFLLVSWGTPVFHGSFGYFWTKNQRDRCSLFGGKSHRGETFEESRCFTAEVDYLRHYNSTWRGTATVIYKYLGSDRNKEVFSEPKMAWHIFGIVPYTLSPFKLSVLLHVTHHPYSSTITHMKSIQSPMLLSFTKEVTEPTRWVQKPLRK